ncbi:conserved hypothetical protein [uncultured Paludibacter sp.]|nr:conserved hypothetical protein [uncultured Paludibacter sp.]
MYNIIRFWFFSKNKKTYAELAKKHHTSAWHIYCFAHGKKPKTSEENEIVSSLKELKIIGYAPIKKRKITW